MLFYHIEGNWLEIAFLYFFTATRRMRQGLCRPWTQQQALRPVPAFGPFGPLEYTLYLHCFFGDNEALLCDIILA